MKTYILTVSRVFPTTHKRKGESTLFPEKILANKYFDVWNNEGTYGHRVDIDWDIVRTSDPKLHTIRSNYLLWSKRIKEIQEGKAILSIRYWSGKPYNSKQVEICQLDKDSGIGVQEIIFYKDGTQYVFKPEYKFIDQELLAKNDGLTLEDFKEWFKDYDLSEPMAIIHFTPFRY